MKKAQHTNHPAAKAEAINSVKEAVDALLASCLRAAADEMQQRSEALLLEMLRRGRL